MIPAVATEPARPSREIRINLRVPATCIGPFAFDPVDQMIGAPVRSSRRPQIPVPVGDRAGAQGLPARVPLRPGPLDATHAVRRAWRDEPVGSARAHPPLSHAGSETPACGCGREMRSSSPLGVLGDVGGEAWYGTEPQSDILQNPPGSLQPCTIWTESSETCRRVSLLTSTRSRCSSVLGARFPSALIMVREASPR